MGRTGEEAGQRRRNDAHSEERRSLGRGKRVKVDRE